LSYELELIQEGSLLAIGATFGRHTERKGDITASSKCTIFKQTALSRYYKLLSRPFSTKSLPRKTMDEEMSSAVPPPSVTTNEPEPSASEEAFSRPNKRTKLEHESSTADVKGEVTRDRRKGEAPVKAE
jgi:hypothetical protein